MGRAWPASGRRTGTLLFKALTARGLVHVWVFWTFDEALRAETLEAFEIAQGTGSTAAENTARGHPRRRAVAARRVGRRPRPSCAARPAQATTLLGVGAIYEWWLMLLLTLRGESARRRRPDGDLAAGTAITPTAPVLMRALLGYNRLLAGDDAGARTAIADVREWPRELGCMQCSLTLDMYAAEVLAELGDAEAAAGHVRAGPRARSPVRATRRGAGG